MGLLTLYKDILLEAEARKHFKERVSEVLYNIQSIQIPQNVYLPNIPENIQNAWIIAQIQAKIQTKIDAIIAKNYPIGGSCVLVPLGMIKIQPLNGNPVNVLITVERQDGLKSGMSYNVSIYDNRITTLLLPDPKHPNNSSVGKQLEAHIKNTINGGYRVDNTKSFIDRSFMGNNIIQMGDFKY